MTTEEFKQVMETMKGSQPQVTNNFYAPIGQQINHVDTINAHFDKDMKMKVDNCRQKVEAKGGEGDAPDVLDTEEARRLWKIAQDNGWVDEKRQPTISQKKAAVLASVIGDALSLSPFWRHFELLWGWHDLATKFSQAKVTSYYAVLYREMTNKLC